MQVDLILSNFNKSDTHNSWESIKLKIQSVTQQFTQYRLHQMKNEIKGLKRSISEVNSCIFQGEKLETDRLQLEELLQQAHDQSHFEMTDNLDWVCLEGKPYKAFLHLEDTYHKIGINSLWDTKGVVTSDTDAILDILHEFYSNLYSGKQDVLTLEDIQKILDNIPSIPKLIGHLFMITLLLHMGFPPVYVT